MIDTIKTTIEIPKPPDGWEFVGHTKSANSDKAFCGDKWIDIWPGFIGLIARKRKPVVFTEGVEAVVVYLWNPIGFYQTKYISGKLNVDKLLHNRGAKHGSRWKVNATYTLEEIAND